MSVHNSPTHTVAHLTARVSRFAHRRTHHASGGGVRRGHE
jgi:hypothetical protein